MIFEGKITVCDIDPKLTESEANRLIADMVVKSHSVDIQAVGSQDELKFSMVIGDYIKGEGVPRGGRAGYILQKKSDDDFDTEFTPNTADAFTTKVTGVKITQEEFNLAMIREIHKDDWYGVEVTNMPATALPRIGKLDLHRSLPIQNKMKRCLLNVDGSVNYYTHPDNTALKADGTPAILDGRDGDVEVRLPGMYVKFEPTGVGTAYYAKISEYPLEGFVYWGEDYDSAYEASLDRTNPAKPVLRSVVNTTPQFRGGDNNAGWDGTYRSLLGMAAANINQTNFRIYARNKGAYGLNGAGWNQKLNRTRLKIWLLYTIEYANTNCQLPFNPVLDANGFKQGGLGDGVTTLDSAYLSAFNRFNPFIPCGYTNSLGNKTGIVNFVMPAEYPTPLTVEVPSYRGIENPFGHLWEWTDGCKCMIQSDTDGGLSEFYVCDSPANFTSSGTANYELRGVLPRVGGYVKEVIIDEYGDIMPLMVGASSTTYFCDYFYTLKPASGISERGVLFGGYASSGATAGFVTAHTSYAPSISDRSFGSRLCFIPQP